MPMLNKEAFPQSYLSMGRAGVSGKSPNGASWETLKRPTSAPLLTVAPSWRRKEELLLI